MKVEWLTDKTWTPIAMPELPRSIQIYHAGLIKPRHSHEHGNGSRHVHDRSGSCRLNPSRFGFSRPG
jgi:hypothetical protein